MIELHFFYNLGLFNRFNNLVSFIQQHIFIMADTEILLKSLRAQVVGREDAVRTAFIRCDHTGTGQINTEELESALASAGLKFTRHQCITLRRHLDRAGGTTIEEFLEVLGLSAK